jgi:hypothetical protein
MLKDKFTINRATAAHNELKVKRLAADGITGLTQV